MADRGAHHILLVKADLMEEREPGAVEFEAAKAAWRNVVGRDELFDEIRDEGGKLTHYGLRVDNLAGVLANESTPGERAQLRETLAEGQEEALGAMIKHGVETGADGVSRIEGELPFAVDPGGFRIQFHRMVARAAKLAMGIEGAEQAAKELQQALSKSTGGWNSEDADLWKGALESAAHSKNWEGTTVLTYSPETGMISALPHKGEGGSPLTAHDTHVVAQDGGRRPLAIFAGAPRDEPFRQAVAEAYLETYLEGGAMTEAEAKAFERGLGWTPGASGEGRSRSKEEALRLLDGARAGDGDSINKAWDMFRNHYLEKTDCPLQVGAAINGGVHLGVLPSETLGKIFKKLGSWNLPGEGVFAISPEGEEAEKIVARYGRMWTPERRESRTEILTQSDRNFKEGSVGFIRVMRGEFLGATQSGEDPGERRIAAMMGPEGSRFDDKVLGKLDRMLLEIEDKYGSTGDQGPASLPELCDRFLSAEKPGARSPWKKSYKDLKQAYEQYKTSRRGAGVTRGVAAGEKLYDAMASFMVSRFGMDGGEDGARLHAAARALVSSAAKTGYLYLVTDPAGNAVKVGITNNLPERLDDLARENGPMCLAACYAFKSIPVSSWGTELVTEAVEGVGTDTFVALTGLTGNEASAAREAGRRRLAGLTEAFGYDGMGEGGKPDDFTVFCVKGMLSLCGDEARRDGGRSVSPHEMREILRRAPGVDQELHGPLAELWGQYLKGRTAGTDPSYQRDTLKALNKVILSTIAGKELGGVLAEGAEESHGLLGVDSEDRDLVYKYGGQVGPAVAEEGAHRLFTFARRDKGEFFYLGGNFEQIMESMVGVAGGGEVHRYLLAESRDKEWGGKGEWARRRWSEINTTPKPDITLPWSGGVQARIKDLWKTARTIVAREKGAVQGFLGGKPPESESLPVHLQLARVLAGKHAEKPKVKDVVEATRQLLGLKAEAFGMKLKSHGILAVERTEYKSGELRDKIVKAARDTIAETRRGAAGDIPPSGLVEFLANPGGARSAESREEAREAVVGINFPCEDRQKFTRALRMALGSGMGEHGLGGYPVSGSAEEKAGWRKALAGAAGPFLSSAGGYSRERFRVHAAEIMEAADALDREFSGGAVASRIALETYGAVVCGCMPPGMDAGCRGKESKRLSKRGHDHRSPIAGTSFHYR